ncbi:MAG: GTPase domain-containing protein [Hyphomicrobiaceae bacterium]
MRAAVDVLPVTKDFHAYDIQRDGAAPVRLVDSPDINDRNAADLLAAKAADCDALIWVVAADRPDRDLDRIALAAIKAWFRDRPERLAPPMIVVASHIDRLRPIQEWAPPYDVAAHLRRPRLAICAQHSMPSPKTSQSTLPTSCRRR